MRYKKSFYNIEILKDNITYIFNPFKGILSLNDELKNSYNDLDTADDEHIKFFIDNKLIVKDKVDEFKKVKLINNLAKYDKDHLTLSISPTFECNFECSYCFVKKSHITMNDDTKRDILTFVENRLKLGIKVFRVTWFGGEPLLAFDTIEELSKQFISLCDKYMCKYQAFLITNGSLLNKYHVSKLKELHISGMQITLDGSEAIHNERRPLKFGNSFETIINNLKNVECKFNLRINLCKENYSDIYRLIDVLCDTNIKNKIEDVVLSPIFSTDYMTEEEKSKCFKLDEYAKVETDIMKYIFEKGIYKRFDIIRKSVGNAREVFWSFNIDPSGDVYKDEFYMGRKEYVLCNIRDFNLPNIMANDVFIETMTMNSIENGKCSKCNILPECMGGDIQYMSRCDEEGCISLKYNIKDQVELYINRMVKKHG